MYTLYLSVLIYVVQVYLFFTCFFCCKHIKNIDNLSPLHGHLDFFYPQHSENNASTHVHVYTHVQNILIFMSLS